MPPVKNYMPYSPGLQSAKLANVGIAAQQHRACSQVLPLIMEKVEPNFMKWVFAMVIITNE